MILITGFKFKIFFFLIFLFFLKNIGYSQDLKYTRKIIKELNSKEYYGRGYNYNGDKKASQLIIKELKENDVQAFGEKYTQNFDISVNTFPLSMLWKRIKSW